MTDPMELSDIAMIPVSRSLIPVRIAGNLLWISLLTLASAVASWWWNFPWGYCATGALVLLGLWVSWLIPRQVKAMAYGEGKTEFVVRRGIMFRSLTLIPYGRIQYVDISEGPIARHYGISSLRIHTASSETSGTVDGIPAEDAIRLRDMLAERGNAEMAGL